MDQRFLADTVCRRASLFDAMVEFNRSRLLASGPSPALSFCLKNAPALLNDPAVRRACANASPETGFPGWWDFSEETQRLVLLPAEALHRLAFCFSAAVHAEELALVLDRERVRELRTCMGDDIFSYAIRRGRYQIGSLRQGIMAHLPPLPLLERVLLLARTVLLLMAEPWPERLRQLWQEKLLQMDRLFPSSFFSEDAAPFGPLPQLSREQRRALWFTLKKILLREAAPQWAPCFD